MASQPVEEFTEAERGAIDQAVVAILGIIEPMPLEARAMVLLAIAESVGELAQAEEGEGD